MSWLENIKYGFKKNPFMVIWKLVWLIPVLCVGVVFALSLVILHLEINTARDFLRELI